MRKATLLSLICLLATVPLFATTAAEYAAQGRAALMAGQTEKASELITKALAAEPNNAGYHFLLGQAYGVMAQKASMLSKPGWAKKTKAEFERAVELDPNNIDVRMALISYYTVAPGFLGGSEEKALAQAAEIKRRDAIQGHRAYGRIYQQQKKPDLARKEYVDAVRENPKNAKAHYYLANYLLTEKNFPSALHEYDMALSLDPAFMPTYFRLGQYAAQSGSNYARGEEALRKYLAYKPSDDEPNLASAWYWLGQVQE